MPVRLLPAATASDPFASVQPAPAIADPFVATESATSMTSEDPFSSGGTTKRTVDHGAQREVQLAALREAEPLSYYWALEDGRKWLLRKGEWLSDDSERTLGENELHAGEPEPLYRAFEPFVGDANMAAARFGNPYSRANADWEKRGRAVLEAELATRGAAHPCTGNYPLPSDADDETVAVESDEALSWIHPMQQQIVRLHATSRRAEGEAYAYWQGVADADMAETQQSLTESRAETAQVKVENDQLINRLDSDAERHSSEVEQYTSQLQQLRTALQEKTDEVNLNAMKLNAMKLNVMPAAANAGRGKGVHALTRSLDVNRIFFDYFDRGYQMFLEGEDDTSELEDQMLMLIEAKMSSVKQDIEMLTAANTGLADEVHAMTSGETPLQRATAINAELLADQEKFSKHYKKLLNYHAHISAQLEKNTDEHLAGEVELVQLKQEIEAAEVTISQQTVPVADIKRMRSEQTKLERELKLVKEQKSAADQQLYDTNAKLSWRLDRAKTMSDYHAARMNTRALSRKQSDAVAEATARRERAEEEQLAIAEARFERRYVR